MEKIELIDIWPYCFINDDEDLGGYPDELYLKVSAITGILFFTDRIGVSLGESEKFSLRRDNKTINFLKKYFNFSSE